MFADGHADGDGHAGFGHLIQPIRDIVENWNIDIADELSDYLQELEKLKISFDGGDSTLNFAEAAMVIQGSACIYSKKVEYLYALIRQTLNWVEEQSKKKTCVTAVPRNGADIAGKEMRGV